jgi:hypothetical protein
VKLFKRPARFLSIFAFVLSALLLGNGGTAAAASPLLCFSGTTDGGANGICTLIAGGAILNTVDGDTIPDNNYAGVYYAHSSISGELLSDVSNLSFTYTGTPTLGSPRITLPIDTDNDGDTDFWLSIGAFYCNNGAGLVDPMTDTTCTLWSNLNGTTPLADNWAALIAAHPDWTVGDELPFLIADDPGLWTVSNVHLGEAAKAVTAKDKCKNGGWEHMTRTDNTTFKNQGDCIQYVNTGK